MPQIVDSELEAQGRQIDDHGLRGPLDRGFPSGCFLGAGAAMPSFAARRDQGPELYGGRGRLGMRAFRTSHDMGSWSANSAARPILLAGRAGASWSKADSGC